jgi:hypothetical protein
MDDPCPGSSRNDGSKDFQGTSTVSLPDGCSNAGPHDSSIHWINPDDDYYSTTVAPFGEFTFSPATSDVDFRYNNCTWVCEISNVEAETTILVRHPATLLPDQVSVSQASDVPCNEVILAMFDLHDTDLTDDIGAPRSKYWCHTATCHHETKHRTDWQGFYGEKLAIAIECVESFCESNIDCGDPDTITCQAAENYWQDRIQEQFNEAYDDARKAMDDPSTDVKECEVWAYLVSYEYENAIYALLPEGCTP